MYAVSTKKMSMYEKIFGTIRHAVHALSSLFSFLLEYTKDYREAGTRGADSGDGN